MITDEDLNTERRYCHTTLCCTSQFDHAEVGREQHWSCIGLTYDTILNHGLLLKLDHFENTNLKTVTRFNCESWVTCYDWIYWWTQSLSNHCACRVAKLDDTKRSVLPIQAILSPTCKSHLIGVRSMHRWDMYQLYTAQGWGCNTSRIVWNTYKTYQSLVARYHGSQAVLIWFGLLNWCTYATNSNSIACKLVIDMDWRYRSKSWAGSVELGRTWRDEHQGMISHVDIWPTAMICLMRWSLLAWYVDWVQHK